ncbi:MAG: hypothetical protein WDN47_02895 [Candidatus Doudnabacteria bacterium]
MEKIYWVSRQKMSLGQIKAVREIHGDDVKIIKDRVVFKTTEAFGEYLAEHHDGFTYTTAETSHCLWAAVNGHQEFGVFENHALRRKDDALELKAVYHVVRVSNRVEFQLAWTSRRYRKERYMQRQRQATRG